MIVTSIRYLEAESLFKALISKYGRRWDIMIPPEAHAQLAICNKVLSSEDRRRLLEELDKERNGN